MCLLTRQIKPIITKKDMIVVKRLKIREIYNRKKRINELHYFAHYIDSIFEYIPNNLNTTLLGIHRDKPKDNSSFSDADSEYYKQGPLTNRKLTIIKEGFHFIIEDSPTYNEDLDKYEKAHETFKFLVPKGSQIFLGKTGLGVSNQIIMLKP